MSICSGLYIFSDTETISAVSNVGFTTSASITASLIVVFNGIDTTVPLANVSKEWYVKIGADERRSTML